jgi:hypothetical protein
MILHVFAKLEQIGLQRAPIYSKSNRIVSYHSFLKVADFLTKKNEKCDLDTREVLIIF